MLIPVPKSVSLKDGFFEFPGVLPVIAGASERQVAGVAVSALENLIESQGVVCAKLPEGSQGVWISSEPGLSEGYRLSVSQNDIRVEGHGAPGLFYGLQTLMQLIRSHGARIPCQEIEDQPDFPERGFYHDITRGRIPDIETLRRMIDRCAALKLNQLQLYVEHSFAFSFLPELTAGAQLTAEDILALDAYASERFVELVPSLSSFGHLYEVLRTRQWRHLCEFEAQADQAWAWTDRMEHHTLDATQNESFQLVTRMFSEFLPLFRSNKVNICGDETFDLGKGKTKAEAARIGTGRLYMGFIQKIIHWAEARGLEVQFWGDVILHHPELLPEVPEKAVCLVWDYAPEPSAEKIRAVAETGKKYYVCPGVHGWNHLLPQWSKAQRNIRNMIRYGKQMNATGVLNTDWGDYGHWNAPVLSVPGMAYAAALAWNSDAEFSDSEFHQAADIQIFGTGRNIGLSEMLAHASGHEIYTLADFVWWIERMDADRMHRDRVSEAKTAAGLLRNAAQVSAGLLVSAQGLILCEKQEIRLAVEGAALLNEAGAFFSEGAHEGDPLLADSFARWLSAYVRVWRKSCRESEISRIASFTTEIIHRLRNPL